VTQPGRADRSAVTEAGDRSWPSLLSALLRGQPLSAQDTAWAMGEVMAGEATPVQVAGFVVALRAKGETAAEMQGLVHAMLSHAHRIEVPGPAVDVVGTGGDRSGSVNVSTMSALVVAGAGVPVVKHGSRKASSEVGSADLLEALGVTIAPGPAVVGRCVEEAGFGFCFAPAFHPALAAVAPVRVALGIRTVFNFLGPMANPAEVRYLLLGVSDPVLHDVLAGVAMRRGVHHALVVRGEDGLDEVSVAGRTRVLDVHLDPTGRAEVAEHWLDPTSHGIAIAPVTAIRGGDATRNAALTREVLGGATGPIRDVVVLNAAAALVAADRCGTLDEGVTIAAESLGSGAAARVLDQVAVLSSTS
jgi:anthranilate phosphoribosyltransferase